MASEQNLPSIQVRMQNLTPTSSVVEYYSSKIDKYEAHLAALMTTLEEYKLSHEHQLNIEKKVRDVMDQNENLQQSLTSLRLHLFDLKKTLLQMKAENGRLKLQEMADRKTIHHLLTLCGNVDQKTATLLLHRQSSVNEIIELPVADHLSNESRCSPQDLNIITLQTDNDVLTLQIKALKAELVEKADLALKERGALVLEFEKLVRDFEARKLSDGTIIEDLRDRVAKLQSITYNELRSFSALPKTVSVPSNGKQTKFSFNEPQSSHLVKKSSDSAKKHSDVKSSDVVHLSKCNHEEIIKDLENRLMKSESICKKQENDIQGLKFKLSQMNDRKERVYDEENAKDEKHLRERIRLLTAQNKNLERRRKLDLEGFRSDIKLLRNELRDIDKQLLKMVLIIGNRKESVDLSALEVIENTAHGSAQIATKLKDLKSKLTKVQTDS